MLDLLLSDVRNGHSHALVLRGGSGVGKTALLAYLADRAPGGRVVRAIGVEGGAEIVYASLRQVCGPLLGYLDELPTVQRAALSTALVLQDGPPPGHLLLGLAMLALFAAAAADGSLVCVLDDAQWLDGMSAVILAFVARRLDAESVALVFAMDTSVPAAADRAPLAGLRELHVEGLCEKSRSGNDPIPACAVGPSRQQATRPPADARVAPGRLGRATTSRSSPREVAISDLDEEVDGQP